MNTDIYLSITENYRAAYRRANGTDKAESLSFSYNRGWVTVMVGESYKFKCRLTKLTKLTAALLDRPAFREDNP